MVALLSDGSLYRFQSTLPVWGATRLAGKQSRMLERFQSTLPVWGATWWRYRSECRCSDFNPRSPCGERQCGYGAGRPSIRFQSTLPVWGATGRYGRIAAGGCISIHAPRVGSDRHDLRRIRHCQISIHAPRVGSDSICAANSIRTKKFQSTLPVWGATAITFGGDRILVYFNPRSPCGERLQRGLLRCRAMTFQSTLPVWGAT